MKSLQLLCFTAISIIVSLLVYGLNHEDPLMTQYEQCLAKCMLMDTTTSEEKISTRFPQLKQALDCITESNSIKSQMNSMMRDPSFGIEKDQVKRVHTMKKQWKDLRVEAKNLLDQILS